MGLHLHDSPGKWSYREKKTASESKWGSLVKGPKIASGKSGKFYALAGEEPADPHPATGGAHCYVNGSSLSACQSQEAVSPSRLLPAVLASSSTQAAQLIVMGGFASLQLGSQLFVPLHVPPLAT